jgi:mRNA-degrading endonuclease YafQ of YafQ-DinJ toxin-antitoxin module/PHD/YefM family antitoxin component YafN of YafNO toxin-antitoxin module
VNSIPAQDIKRRGISAVDEALRDGPVHVIKNNRPSYVVLTEAAYAELLESQREAARERLRESLADLEAGRTNRYEDADALIQGSRRRSVMSFALVTTQHFERRARKFLRKHPDLRPALRDTLDDLSRDPFQPQLKLHPLSGNLAGVQAVSLTYSYRLTLLVRVTEREIVLLDIGTHDEVYR